MILFSFLSWKKISIPYSLERHWKYILIRFANLCQFKKHALSITPPSEDAPTNPKSANLTAPNEWQTDGVSDWLLD